MNLDIEYVRWTSTGCQAVLLGRLVYLRLFRRYPMFSAFLAANLIRSSLLFQEPSNTEYYLRTWVFTEPVLMVLLLLAAIEAIRLTMEAYPGRRNALTLLLVLFSSVATAVMATTAALDAERPSNWWYALHGIAAARRTLTGTLAICLFCATCWLAFLPVPERPNVRLHRLMLTLYVTTGSLAQLAINLGFDRPRMNAAALVGTIICYLGWLFVTADGERELARETLSDEEIERLDAQAASYRRMLR